ncbi:hypothetical protein KKG41_00230 [Patescibacteria group bacterium]|nr:hypothetical protein [Patescibacteria group bacterium]MBU1890651.1 hypothetical protein [Patescibacteria group bacterium]
MEVAYTVVRVVRINGRSFSCDSQEAHLDQDNVSLIGRPIRISVYASNTHGKGTGTYMTIMGNIIT